MDDMNEKIIDLEEFAKKGEKPPEGKKYRIRIDREKYVVSVPEMTGRELLELAGKIPVEEYAIYQKLKGGKTVRIELEEKADFRTPGVERFVTLPLDQTEGRGNPRIMFSLPEFDLINLSSRQFHWETVIENGVCRLVIYDYPIPSGYNIDKVDLNLRIEANYPDVQIDMVYFHPTINRLDNVPIKATAAESFDGRTWQRWSRHRTSKNPWRPGIDDVSTHLQLVNEWLNMELKKGL